MDLIERLRTVESAALTSGSHETREHGLCVMEAVSFVANEKHSDQPQCACPVISAFMRSWNDSLSDEDRDRLLKPMISQLLNSRSTPEVEIQRSFLACDWLIRTFTPTWLSRVPSLQEHAMRLRQLEPIDCEERVITARVALSAAWDAAWDAAGDAAWAAARDAARAAAGDAAWDAAGAAAWDAAGDAAGDAAWAAARDAAGAAARAAAGDAAWAAARAAARDAAGAAARAAARDAAGDALESTVRELQQSALDLIDRMLKCSAESERI